MQIQTPNGNFVRISTTALLALLLLAYPLVTVAFKPITHVWIAQQILNDLEKENNHVVIDGEKYFVDEEIAKAIRENASEYRMGFIGPDAFPDVVVGQMTMHPGDPGDPRNPEAWQSDTWMRELLKAAGKDGPSKSFAYGYIGHAASDIFAHTYVNTYAGDVFEIIEKNPCEDRDDKRKCWRSEGRAFRRKTISRFANEEKRHFALESFIAKYTPPIRDHKGNPVQISEHSLKVPTAFVADFFMQANDDVLKAYEGQVLAWHLILMEEHRRNIEGRQTSSPSPIAADARKQNEARGAELATIAKLSESIDELPEVSKSKSAKPDKSDVLKKLRDVITKLDNRVQDCTATCADEWLGNIEQAMLDYIEMSRNVGIQMAKTKGDPKQQWDKWVDESSYLLLPPDLAKEIKKIKKFLKDLEEKWGIRHVRKLKEYLGTKVDRLTQKLAVAGVGIFLGSSNRALLEVILFDNINAEKLDRIYKAGGSKKMLLKLHDMSDRAIHDMTLDKKATEFDPKQFSAIKHALTLSKLSLLGPSELNRLVRRYLGADSPVVFRNPKPDEPFNILFDAVRSIDGDHQWNEFAPPYLRSDNSGCTAPLRYYGYADDGSGKGFKLWTDEKLRTQVFLKLFDTMIASGMYDGTFAFPTKLDPCYTDRYRPTREDPFPIIKAHPKKISG